MSGLEAALKTTFLRWNCWVHPNYDQTQIGEIMAISLGLGALFNEDEKAEREWMRRANPNLRTTPLISVLRGNTRAVLDLVNSERSAW